MGIITWIRKKFGAVDAVFLRVPLDNADGELYASPMPFGPYDKLNQVLGRYRETGIEFAIPLVTEDEIRRKAKRDIFAEYYDAGIEVIHLPIADLTSPSLEAIAELVKRVGPYLQSGAKVAVHCNAGVGRTGVVLACLKSSLDGLSGGEALAFVEGLMITQITDSQKRVVKEFAALYTGRLPTDNPSG